MFQPRADYMSNSVGTSLVLTNVFFSFFYVKFFIYFPALYTSASVSIPGIPGMMEIK